MGYLEELEQLLDRDGDITNREVLEALRRMAGELAAWRDKAADRIQKMEADNLEITLVDTVADLPASAGPRQWFRVTQGTVQERVAVYVGNGAGNPLRRLDTVAI